MDKKDIIEFLKQDNSIRQASQKFGLSVTRISVIAHQSGISKIYPANLRKRLKAKRNKLILQALRKGSSFQQVSKQFSLNINYVRHIGRQNGIRQRVLRTEMTQRYEQIKQLAKAGKTTQQIADILHMHPEYLRLIKRNLGVSSYPLRREQVKQRNNRIGELIKAGKPSKQIMAKFKVGNSTVSKVRIQLGLATRKR